MQFETRDPKTGEIVRYNADDDNITLGDLLREEKFGAGMSDQKNLDAELARAIMGDGKFENDLEYMDDNAERLGRKKMRSDAMKRQFAIQGQLSFPLRRLALIQVPATRLRTNPKGAGVVRVLSRKRQG